MMVWHFSTGTPHRSAAIAIEGSVAPQEAARIVRIGEPMNHIYADHKNRLYSWIGGDQPGADSDQRWKRRAGAAHIESAGILRAKLIL
jgi:hypothetical protein